MKRLCTALVIAMLLMLALTACDVTSGAEFKKESTKISVSRLSSLQAGSPESDAPTADESQTDGAASSQPPVDMNEDAAREIALAHAGVSAADVPRIKVELDREKGIFVYEVEFRAGADEYEYDIHAESGEILRAEKNDRKLVASAPAPEAPVETPPEQPAETVPPTVPQTIGEDAAREIALAHAGVSAADVPRIKVELDREKGVLLYEVEFKWSGYEYEYEIHATDGTILQSEKEFDD